MEEKMSESDLELARREIDESLSLCRFCMTPMGLSFDKRRSASARRRQKTLFIFTVVSMCYHVFGDLMYIAILMANSPRVEDVVPLLHTFGYGLLSIAKVFVLWYKIDVFGQLLDELAGIWPTPPLDEHAQTIKDKSLTGLRMAQKWYVTMNLSGVWFYNLTPIFIYFYQTWQGEKDAQVGYVWVAWYPFDKHKPLAHVFVYIFEMFAGQSCVWIMLGTDLLFSAMASHICLLLKLLQKRLESLALSDEPDEEHYKHLIEDIKLHQRLIRYCNDLEDAFSVSNLVNIIMSSVNICCVVFVIVLLEPFLAISNKLFLGSALIQIGLICWYGDDILHANADIAVSAYNSGWYHTSPKCRRALLFLLIRSQKPIAFTAMKFTYISLVTYSSIISRSYSYFALLYTMYSNN